MHFTKSDSPSNENVEKENTKALSSLNSIENKNQPSNREVLIGSSKNKDISITFNIVNPKAVGGWIM